MFFRWKTIPTKSLLPNLKRYDCRLGCYGINMDWSYILRTWSWSTRVQNIYDWVTADKEIQQRKNGINPLWKHPMPRILRGNNSCVCFICIWENNRDCSGFRAHCHPLGSDLWRVCFASCYPQNGHGWRRPDEIPIVKDPWRG